jgi:hypothetical protein
MEGRVAVDCTAKTPEIALGAAVLLASVRERERGKLALDDREVIFRLGRDAQVGPGLADLREVALPRR